MKGVMEDEIVVEEPLNSNMSVGVLVGKVGRSF